MQICQEEETPAFNLETNWGGGAILPSGMWWTKSDRMIGVSRINPGMNRSRVGELDVCVWPAVDHYLLRTWTHGRKCSS
jgi:hypothetical protein